MFHSMISGFRIKAAHSSAIVRREVAVYPMGVVSLLRVCHGGPSPFLAGRDRGSMCVRPWPASKTAQKINMTKKNKSAVYSLSSDKMMKVLELEFGIRGRPVRDEITDLFHNKYMKFFEAMSFDPNAKDWSGSHEVEKVYNALVKVRSSYDFSTPIPENMLRGCCGFPAIIIRYRSFEDKVKIAHGTLLITAIEDNATRSTSMGGHDNFMEDLSLFHVKAFNLERYEKLYPNRGPLHPLLEELITYLRTDLNPFSTQLRHENMLIKCALDFIEACQLENDYNDSNNVFEVTEEMVKFPEFIRLKSSASELYLLFQLTGPELVPGRYLSKHSDEDEQFFYRHLYPMIVELQDVCTHINDYLSFYKEAQEGDMASYVFTYAKQKHIPPFEAMDEIMTLIVDAKNRVIKMAERSGYFEVKEAIAQYIDGFISWHIWWNKRYKLKEILGDGYHSPCI